MSESGPEAVKTPGIAAGNILFVPNTCSALPRSSKSFFVLCVLCVLALAAIGCGNAGPELEDTARNISRRSSELNDASAMAGRASEESYAAATEADEEEEDLAEDAMAADEMAEDEMAEDSEGAAAGAGAEPPPAGGLISDDSPLCGNGVLDVGERCDIKIEDGEGACPTSCEQPDACHAGKLVVKGCWTTCEVGELVDC